MWRDHYSQQKPFLTLSVCFSDYKRPSPGISQPYSYSMVMDFTVKAKGDNRGGKQVRPWFTAPKETGAGTVSRGHCCFSQDSVLTPSLIWMISFLVPEDFASSQASRCPLYHPLSLFLLSSSTNTICFEDLCLR